jgi:hypothetical protein
MSKLISLFASQIILEGAALVGYLQQYAKITIHPEKIPPTPTPATALPTIKALLVGAVAQTRDL